MKRVLRPKPARSFHPGEFIMEELEARHWTVEMLIASTGIPEFVLRPILEGKRSLTAMYSDAIGRVFGVSPRFFENLQTAYDHASTTAREGRRG